MAIPREAVAVPAAALAVLILKVNSGGSNICSCIGGGSGIFL
jgi:hypothetical protein